MKIDRIKIENLLGAVLVDVPTRAPIQLFSGHNHAGKSSTRDGVVLALTADLGRVSAKKDAPQLIHGSAGSASAEVTTVDGDLYGVTITRSGKMADTKKGVAIDPAMAYVLDGQRFADLDDKDRRAFLLGLLGVKMDAKSIVARLVAAGCEAAKVDLIAPLLRAGFASAAEDAAKRSTLAKGAWRGLTGETYGAVKAASWRAPVAPFSQAGLDAALSALAAIDGSIAAAQQSVGSLSARAGELSKATRQRADLQDAAACLVRRKTKLATDEAGLKAAQDALDRATAKAGSGPRVGLVHDLALLVSVATFANAGHEADAVAALTTYEAEHGPVGDSSGGDPEARASLPNLRDAVDLMGRAVANAMRDLKLSEAAESQIKLLDEQIKAAGDGGAAELEQARKQLATAQAERKDAAAAVDSYRAAKAAAEGADRKTADAAKHHADVEAWDKIATELSPDGIQAKLLGEALGPVNGRLAQSAIDADWPAVVIGADMSITSGGRPRRMLSASECWACDAMIAEAVAHLSGLRLLVLDGFDVLLGAERDNLFAWLDVLAEIGEIDTALVFGSLKAKPADMGEFTDMHWIEAGRCVELALEAA